MRHYETLLAKRGIWLEMPPPARRIEVLRQMGIPNPEELAEKTDIVALGKPAKGGAKQPFGAIHVKASFAERRTDDVPLSQLLIARGLASPLVPMDCKASPGPAPVNRGELGPTQGGSEAVSAKRYDIERDNKFDACFSYNQNTKPTPAGQAAAARIYVVDFANPDDRLSQHLVADGAIGRGWSKLSPLSGEQRIALRGWPRAHRAWPSAWPSPSGPQRRLIRAPERRQSPHSG